MPSSPKAQGELVEIRFLLEATSHGLVVAKPWGDNLPFDFLVGRGSRFVRVQVRSSRHRPCRGYQVLTTHRHPATPYTARDLDFLAAYIIPAKTWYVVPVKAFAPRQAIYVYPSQLSRGPARFEKFREAWHLLRR